MIIHGLMKQTLLDFPGRLACTVFTGGCNFRCPFCHNATLVLHPDDQEKITEEEFFDFLKKRGRWLDGVAITGGEPMLQKDLKDFMYKIKETGLAVKLDTNGAFPEKLRDIVEAGLADYVAMDFKNLPEFYGETVGVPGFDPAPVIESMSYLREGHVEYEFRTTVIKEFHPPERMEAMAKYIEGVPAYYLQNFVASDRNIAGGLTEYTPEELFSLLDIVRKYVPNADIRGVDMGPL